MSNVTGLSQGEVAERVAGGLTNAFDETTSRPLAEIIKANVLTRFNAILGVLFVVVMATDQFADALFGFLVVINSLAGIVQEYLAKRKLDRLAFLHAPTANVVRDGVVLTIATRDIVLGDLVELHGGDQVPADGVVIVADSLEVNEANLTGETDAVVKQDGDRVMSGTIVVSGNGRFVTDAVGPAAYAQRLSAEAKVFTRAQSEIHGAINTLLRYITWAIVIAIPLQWWSQFHSVREGTWRDATIRASAGLIGLVPEGLVLLTTLAFLTAAVQLARKQVLVQELPAVEGLARVSVVCLDKTGTLTTGRIVFEGIEILEQSNETDVRAALGALANDPNANSTLTTIAESIDQPPDWVCISRTPFNSTRKWAGAHFSEHGSWVLGAPDVLLEPNHSVLERVTELAEEGRRVLLVAYSSNALDGTVLPSMLQPFALVVLREEIRPDAAETLHYFAEQDVAVKIISGDNPVTVAAIARQVGLLNVVAVDAQTIGSKADELRDVVTRASVFGRVSPQQKRSLVHALQDSGHVVAMTGDGVNDALALKRADIGIAMDNAAPATKAVAQLILLDGRFSHLPSVILEGRRVIGNVERVANLFVAKNAMSFIAIVSAAILQIRFPMLPRHLTLLSTVTIGIPAFLLALGPNAKRYEPGMLRRIVSFAVPAGAIAGIAVVVADVFARWSYQVGDGIVCTVDDAKAPIDPSCWRVGTGATLAVLIVFLWILVILARPLRTWKVALIASMMALVVVSFTVPFAKDFFNFNLPLGLFAQSLAIGAAGGWLVEILHRRRMAETVHSSA